MDFISNNVMMNWLTNVRMGCIVVGEVSMRLKYAGLLLLFSVMVISAGCARQTSFSKQVQPILQEHCQSCHQPGGEGYARSGFSVDGYENVMAGTRLGPVIVPGSSVSSTLMLLMGGKAHASIAMPREQPPMEAGQIKLIRQWIDQGAKNN